MVLDVLEGDLVTKSEFAVFQERYDNRFAQFESRVNLRLEQFVARMDQFEQRIGAKFDQFENKMVIKMGLMYAGTSGVLLGLLTWIIKH